MTRFWSSKIVNTSSESGGIPFGQRPRIISAACRLAGRESFLAVTELADCPVSSFRQEGKNNSEREVSRWYPGIIGGITLTILYIWL